MPSVSLTPQQQASIDAANVVLATAQKGYDNAIANLSSVKDNLCNAGWWSYLTNCDVKNVQSKALNVSLTLAYLSGPYGIAANVINNWTQKRWEKPSSCQDAIDKGIIVTWECHRGTGDCIRKEGCDNRVNEYNAKLNGYYSAATQVDGAKAALQSAKDGLTTALNAIAADPTVVANQNIITTQIDAQKQKDMIKWAFFGLATVIIVGAAIFIGMKLLKGKSAA